VYNYWTYVSSFDNVTWARFGGGRFDQFNSEQPTGQ
jgi:hypothetical protein